MMLKYFIFISFVCICVFLLFNADLIFKKVEKMQDSKFMCQIIGMRKGKKK